MGREVKCSAAWNGQRSEGKALLETGSVVFRGDFRVEVPFPPMTRVAVSRGRLTIESRAGTLVLDLGPHADRWAEKIRNPPTLADKLGITDTTRVAVIGVCDPAVLEAVRGRAKTVTARPGAGSEIVIIAMDRATDLRRFERLRQVMPDDGAIWSIRPKGVAEVSESAVRASALAAGLVDVKVARVSATHTAEKFVLPRSSRRAARRRSARSDAV
jgi:hypothetical protein